MFAEERYVVGLRVNGKLVDDAALMLRRPDGYYVARPALAAAGIIISGQPKFIAGPGADYVALDSLPSVRVTFDEEQQELVITAGADAVEAQNLTIGAPNYRDARRQGASGGFLNYDMIGQSGIADYIASYLDGGMTLGGGMLLATGLANSQEDASAFTRLDTAYLYDFPEDKIRLKIGDGISRGGDWGRPYRFGGVQLATNFDIQPGYVPFPVPGLTGQAALPSTVDVFVNNSLQYRGAVEQGPFAVNQIPAVNGGGEAIVVLTDPLGRQETVRLPYYVSTKLLRQGTSSFSYEAGMLRKNYQSRSNDYEHPSFSATHRYGLSESWTVEGHSDVTDSHQSLGASATTALVDIGELTMEAAGANGSGEAGSLFGYGWTRAQQDWSFNFRQRWYSGEFQNPDIVGRLSNPTSETVAGVSFSPFGLGAFTVSATRLTYETQDDALIGSLFWSKPVTRSVFAGCYGLAARQTDIQYTLGCGLTVMLGNSNSITSELQTQDGRLGGTVQARHSAGVDDGLGYGITAARGQTERYGGDALYRTSVGDFSAAGEQFDGRLNGRIGASGGLAFVGGRSFVSRRIDDSFALVSVPGYADVTVLQENRQIGKTDEDGDLFIPKLTSNLPVRLDIDTGDLPMDADVAQHNRVVVANYRQPMHVLFEVNRDVALLMHIEDDAGEPLPAGSRVIRRADKAIFYVGFDGEAFLKGSGAKDGDVFDVDWAGGACVFRAFDDSDKIVCRRAS